MQAELAHEDETKGVRLQKHNQCPSVERSSLLKKEKRKDKEKKIDDAHVVRGVNAAPMVTVLCQEKPLVGLHRGPFSSVQNA